MNVFATSATFRRGNPSAVPVEAMPVPRAAVPLALPQAQPTTTPSQPPTLQPLGDEAGAAAHVGGLPYPEVPYYGLLSFLEVRIDISCIPGYGSGTHQPDANMNATATAAVLPRMQRHLQAAVAHSGRYYVMGSLDPATRSLGSHEDAPLQRDVRADTRVAAAATSSSLLPQVCYQEYLLALQALLRAMSERRSAVCDEATGKPTASLCHHTAMLRVMGHPTLKDLLVSLSIERGRLVLFVTASSRVTQQYLSERMELLGVALDWVAGAALVWEPAALAPSAANPVYYLWDTLLDLPLVPTRLSSTGAAAGAWGPRMIEGLGVTIVSSVPFPGAACRESSLRLTEQIPILCPNTSTPVGRRYVWRVVGPTGLPNVILPRCLTHIVRCLAMSGVTAFDLVCGVLRGGDGVTAARRGGGPVADTGAVATGLAPVHAVERGPTTARGASTPGWSALSRLSCHSWLSDADRARFGLLEVDEDGAQVELECEFELCGVRYRGPAPPTDGPCPPVPLFSLKRCREDEAESADSAHLVMPSMEGWGPYLEWRISVTRLIVDAEGEQVSGV